MILLPPEKIGDQIIELIENSTKILLIISPYCEFINWDRLKTALTRAHRRGIPIRFFTRAQWPAEDNPSIDWLEDTGIDVYSIKNLHAKLYMNESSAILTSLNLLHYSAIYSLEIGVQTQDINLIKQLHKEYYHLLFEKSKPVTYYNLTFSSDIPSILDIFPDWPFDI